MLNCEPKEYGGDPMPFLKLNEFYINTDCIYYVQEQGEQYLVCFNSGTDTPKKAFVNKHSPEAGTLMSALGVASNPS
jgi:hypothetical protein